MAVNTTIGDVNQFLDHIVASTNMKCLTPPRALEGECGYLAANLYARCGAGRGGAGGERPAVASTTLRACLKTGPQHVHGAAPLPASASAVLHAPRALQNP